MGGFDVPWEVRERMGVTHARGGRDCPRFDRRCVLRVGWIVEGGGLSHPLHVAGCSLGVLPNNQSTQVGCSQQLHPGIEGHGLGHDLSSAVVASSQVFCSLESDRRVVAGFLSVHLSFVKASIRK